MKSLLVRKIDRTYACVQGLYWLSEVGLGGYITVFLSHRGLQDMEIAFTVSALAVVSIVLQMVLSNAMDHRPSLTIGSMIQRMYLYTILLSAVLYWVPLSIPFLILVFVLAVAAQRAIESFLNALMMQYVNKGLAVTYSWPRGIGSICYAIGAFGLGRLFDITSPDILLPLCILFSLLGMWATKQMPEVSKLDLSNETLGPVVQIPTETTSYKEMFKTNPTLVFFLVTGVFTAIAMSGYGTFLIRIIEGLGGSNSELGLAMFIQSGIELPAMFLATRILRRIKPVHVWMISIVCFFIKGIAIAFVSSLTMLYFLMAFSFFCFGFYGFSVVLFVNEISKNCEKVRAQSLTSLCFTGGVGGILGNAFCGSYLVGHTFHQLLVTSSIFGVLSIVTMLLCYRFYKKRKTVEQ